MSSTSSIDRAQLGPGTELAGFRLERAIGRGSSAAVWEATQLSLDRRVAVKLFPQDPELAARLRRLCWPEHPAVVDLYSAGACDYGQYVATQLVRGSSLSELHGRDELTPAATLAALRDAAGALDSAHRQEIAHGAVSARKVLVDERGRAFMCDFGLGGGTASPASDRVAFAALACECLGVDLSGEFDSATAIIEAAAAQVPPAVPATPRRRQRRHAILAAAVALSAVAVLIVAIGGSDEGTAPTPPLPEGTEGLGSSLSAQGASSVDCLGRSPAGASAACTLVQTRLPGRRLVARSDGVIRSWTVRGARGELALQVLRRRGARFVWVARTPYVPVPDDGLHVLPAAVALRAGDLVGVNVAPGGAVGVRLGAAGTAGARWLGLSSSSSPATVGELPGFSRELLLRVAYEPGARLEPGLTGRAADRAPRGVRLAARVVEPRNGGLRTVAIVRVADRLVLDMFAGRRRLVRLPIEDASAGGRPIELITYGRPLLSLRWRNPDGRTIEHDYAIRARAVLPRS